MTRWGLAAVAAVLLAAAAAALAQYSEAVGEVRGLRVEAANLRSALRSVAAERDNLRSVGDSLGLVNDSLNAVVLASVRVQVQRADSVRVMVVQQVPPEFRRQVEDLDDRRLATIAALEAAVEREQQTVRSVRAQLLAERANSDEAAALAAQAIRNLELQVAAMQRAAQASFMKRSVSAGKWVALGLVVGLAIAQ